MLSHFLSKYFYFVLAAALLWPAITYQQYIFWFVGLFVILGVKKMSEDRYGPTSKYLAYTYKFFLAIFVLVILACLWWLINMIMIGVSLSR